jgi:hypothetical protein
MSYFWRIQQDSLIVVRRNDGMDQNYPAFTKHCFLANACRPRNDSGVREWTEASAIRHQGGKGEFATEILFSPITMLGVPAGLMPVELGLATNECLSGNSLDLVIFGKNFQKTSSKMKPFWLGARNICEEFHKTQSHLRGKNSAKTTLSSTAVGLQ